jgi:succinate dehydrogenase / fumarate reductase iron-sulfur subunit
LGRKIFRRDQLDKPAGYATAPAGPVLAAASAPSATSTAPSATSAGPEAGSASTTTEQEAAHGTQGDISVNWHREAPPGQAALVDENGRLPITEFTTAWSGAASPFGDDVELPMGVEDINYQHPRRPEE